ncbi:MAG: cytidine deaminase [Spirochaetales bacterium]|nr:cytidine deaminase [Spirochaetales bacterium]
MDNKINEYLLLAKKAAKKAYAPFSQFHVGCMLVTESGEVFPGCNIENRSFGLTICAERSALSAAVTAGKKEFSALYLYTPDAKAPVPPCGACRQVLSEFVGPNFPVYYTHDGQTVIKKTMQELLPFDSLHDLKD